MRSTGTISHIRDNNLCWFSRGPREIETVQKWITRIAHNGLVPLQLYGGNVARAAIGIEVESMTSEIKIGAVGCKLETCDDSRSTDRNIPDSSSPIREADGATHN